ncbi:hypothetical protein M5K25_007067 [Dendrobium thyrsiflorum]|uniref:Uncharacterized protein n=1 Tax=Dendrobium thyrsiflorum TaxID=117978 RepID=A0ABD0VD96_DENTH
MRRATEVETMRSTAASSLCARLSAWTVRMASVLSVRPRRIGWRLSRGPETIIELEEEVGLGFLRKRLVKWKRGKDGRWKRGGNGVKWHAAAAVAVAAIRFGRFPALNFARQKPEKIKIYNNLIDHYLDRRGFKFKF